MQSESEMKDPDMLNATAALIRAGKRAKKLAEQTGTEYVVVRDGKLVKEIPQPPAASKRPSSQKSS